MSRLEIIHLRTPGGDLARLGREIAESFRLQGKRCELLSVYRRAELETDVAIHIRGLAGDAGEGPSTLGLHLASALRAYGLVEHTLWEELI